MEFLRKDIFIVIDKHQLTTLHVAASLAHYISWQTAYTIHLEFPVQRELYHLQITTGKIQFIVAFPTVTLQHYFCDYVPYAKEK